MQVKQAVEQRFPGMEVQGGAYPVAPMKVCRLNLLCAAALCTMLMLQVCDVQAALGKAMMILQFSLIGLVVFGDQLFAALGMQAPGFYGDIREKKLIFGMGAWFLGNMVQSSLNSTGAFEIFYNGSKVGTRFFQQHHLKCRASGSP